MVKSGGKLALACQSQTWGTRPASPGSTSKYDYNNTSFAVYRNEIVGVEQSFAVFFHGKAASRPFKLTSEMEFFVCYAITLFNFSRGW